MIATLALLSCLAAIAAAWLWSRVMRSQPSSVAPIRAVDDGSMRVTLTQRQRVSIELAALAVSTHCEKAVALGCDYTNSAGVGRLVIIVCDDAVYRQAIEPAMRQHLQARSGA